LCDTGHPSLKISEKHEIQAEEDLVTPRVSCASRHKKPKFNQILWKGNLQGRTALSSKEIRKTQRAREKKTKGGICSRKRRRGTSQWGAKKLQGGCSTIGGRKKKANHLWEPLGGITIKSVEAEKG